MIDFVNDRDRLIQATSPRYSVNMAEKAIFLALSAPVFAVNNAGTVATPTAITATVDLLNIVGPITFSVSAGATISVAGNVATLQFSSMSVNTVFITAKAVDTETGVEFLRSAVISKVFDGAKGADGTTNYTWVKYGDSAAGAGLSDSPAGKTYIGLAYNKTTAVESTTPSDYAWSLIKGTDGVPGTPGADGQTFYTWIKYSDNADGTGLYDIPTASTLYIGLSTNRTSATESTIKTDYVWSKFKGDQGVPGANAPPLYTWIKYGDSSAGAGLSDSPVGKTFIGLAYNKPTATESTTPSDYEWALIKGTDGVPGAPGTNGVTLYTWLKYSDYPDGTGLYDIPTATTLYIGLAVNKTTSTESTVKSDYVWSKFKGDQGVPGTTGPNGQRGTKILAVSGYTTWSDASAVAELAAAGFGAPIDRDQVTLYSLTFSMTKYYQGGSWYALGTYIDGNLLVQGSIATLALGAEVVTAAKIDARGLSIKDAAGNVVLSAGTPLTAAYMNAGIGAGNLISNSGPYPGTVGIFGLVQTYSPGTTTFGASETAYVPTGAGGVFMQCSGVVPTGSTATLAAKQGADLRKFPVIPGVRYELSAYVSSHRCRGAVNLAFYNASGTYISEFAGNIVDNSLSTGPLSAWPRSVVFAAAPAGAAYAAVRGVLTGNGGTNAYLFTSLWYFGVALAAQTVPSAWADGPGAGFGDNLYGQITPSNSPTYIANAAIVNAQIGGDIYSSNWNGSTTGWLLDRNGNFYANSGTFRGALSGRNVTAENLATNMALIGTVIRSQTYNPGSYGWMINADGTAEFSALSITGRPTGPVYGQSDMTSYPVVLVTLGSATGIAAAHKVTVQLDGQVTTAAASGSSVTISLYWGSAAGSETTLIKSWTASARGLGSGVWEDEILPFVEQVTVSVPADASRTGSGAYFKALATRTGSSTSGTDAALQISTNIKNPTA